MDDMADWFETLDQLLNYDRALDEAPRQHENVEQLVNLAKGVATRTLEKADSVALPSLGVYNDAVIAQTVIGVIAVILVGFTFLPLGATPSSIRACQLNTDQKLLKYLGVVLVIMTSLCAILYLEVLKLYGILASG